MADLAQLLVEGQDDKHVIMALCKQYNVARTFSIETPSSSGVEALLHSIPVRLKSSGLCAFGAVLDADRDLERRWQAIADSLAKAGYTSVPKQPNPTGTIIDESGKPRVGVWLMPNNQVPGMIEDFVAFLIPNNDTLRPKAQQVLDEIESQKLNRYPLVHHPKALIHTWLAWQQNPGQPMGLAITAQALGHNDALAQSFVNWLNALFG